jgi:hypothetical protein
MLIYQNASASEGSLFGYFSGDPTILASLTQLASDNRAIASNQIDGRPLSLPDADRLLEINKNLRRLYDATASKHLTGFDAAHTPPGGWDFYFERTS